MADELKARLSADTSAFKSGMGQAAETVAQFNARLKAAQEAYNAAAAKGVDVATALGKAFDAAAASGASFVEAMERANEAVQGLEAAEEEETAALTKSVSARMAASSELRILEGNMQGSTRVLGALISQFPILAEAAQAAFIPFAGFAAFEVLDQMGDKVLKIARGFDKVAQAEDRAAAEAKGLTDAFQKIVEDEEQITRQLIEDTQGRVGLLKYDLSHLKLTINSDDVTRIKQAQQEVDKLNRTIREGTNVDSSTSVGVATVIPMTDEAKAAAIDLVEAQKKLDNAIETARSDSGKAQHVQHELGAEEASEASKAAQKKLREIETHFAEIGKVPPDQASAFWSKYLDEFREGSAEYLSVLDKFNAARAAALKQDSGPGKLGKEWKEEQEKIALIGAGGDAVAEGQKAYRKMIQGVDDDLRRSGEHWQQWHEEQAKGSEIAADTARATDIMTASIRLADGQITKLAFDQKVASADAADYAAKLEALQKVLANLKTEGANLKPGDPEYSKNQTRQEQTKNQISQVRGQQSVSSLQDAGKIQQNFHAPFQRVFTTVNSGFNDVVDTWLQGTQKMSVAWAKLGDQIALSAVNELLKKAEDSYFVKQAEQLVESGAKWVGHEALITAEHLLGIAQRKSADTAAAATTQATTSSANVAAALSYAAVAAAAAAAATAAIPIVGPALAPGVAAATYASTAAYGALAAFDIGTDAVPRSGIAMIHQNERIIPSDQNERITRALEGGGGRQSGATHIHFNQNISALDTEGVSGVMRRSNAHAQRELHRTLRNLGLVQ